MEKYFIIFGEYRLSITQKNYNGFSTEIFGNITLTKGEVDTILEPIRGTGLNLSLEANSALTFDEFVLAEEQTYYVQLTKSGNIIYNGFIKPDGIQQSYVNEQWLVNIDVIDGLGAMKDLSFVQSNGLQFTGKLSFYEVIKGCLDRIGLLMPIYSSVALAYDGYVGSNILKDTYVNASRFYKKDGETIMDCNEVLTSILNIFSAVITQENGIWWVYRPTDLKPNTVFINNTLNTEIVFKTNYVLGSQIDNYYPHHCDANQQIEVKGAISAYRLRYEYGFLDGFILNKDLVHSSTMVFDNWTVNPTNAGLIINDPNDLTGVKMYSDFNALLEVMTSHSFTVNAGASLRVKASLWVNAGRQFFRFRLKRSDGKYCNTAGVWTTNPNDYFQGECGSVNGLASTADFSFITESIDANCTVTLTILRPVYAALFGMGQPTEINKIDVTDASQTENGIVGMFYSVSRILPPSSIVKENQTVFNGDSSSLLIGSLYKADKTTLTETWNRAGFTENKPILLISAEDDLRVQRNAIKIFSGGIFGLLPYLSIISINNVLGKFMFTNYSYDLMTNKMNAKLTQLYQDEVGDIEFLITPDYGNTVKPTIKN
jgi:hypothetical protein